MANAIRRNLVSRMAVFLCLASIGCAHEDSDFTTKARRLIAIYNNPAVDEATKETNLESLAKFYEQYSDHIQLHEDEKQLASELLEKHRRLYSAYVVIGDGVAANGWMLSYFKQLVVKEAVELVGKAVERATSSAKGVEINREVAIFGLVFLVASYVFRTKSM